MNGAYARLLLLPALLVLGGWSPVESRSRAVDEGNEKMKAGKPEEALAAYDRALGELPGDPAVRFNRGTALYGLSRFDEAAEDLLKATEAKDPALKASAFYNLGNAFFKKDKHGEAVEAYKRALALDPKNERAKWNLEIALKKKREEEKKKEDEKKDQDKKDDDKKDDKKDQDKKDDKKDDDKKDDKKDQDKKDDKKQADDKQGKQDEPQPQQPAEEPKLTDPKEIEQVLKSLEKSPKDLEKQRARLRAVRRAPPVRDW
jgi:Ca-activated chloride channel homolog